MLIVRLAGPVSCPDVTNLYKSYYNYYHNIFALDESLEDVSPEYKEIHSFLGGSPSEDFNDYPYWTAPELQVKANANTTPPYNVNDFTFERSITINQNHLRPDYFKDSEPESMTLNYKSIRITDSGDTIYITYATPWEEGIW
jgi:hypothetical protein